MIDPLVMRDPICGLSMGETAQKLADHYGIGRQEQDAYAVTSQERARAAIQMGRFARQLVPIALPDGSTVTTDEQPRFDTTLEAISRLRPAFSEGGSITAGNSSTMNDAAAVVIVTSAAYARQRSLRPLAQVLGCTTVGVDPSMMGVGPVPATLQLLAKLGLGVGQIGVWEVNEAFACVVLHFLRQTGASVDRVNPNGGAIALGHPISATGAVLVAKAVHEMRRMDHEYAVVAMCIGGGMGIAMLLQRGEP